MSEMQPTETTLPASLKQARLARGLSQEKLAADLGMRQEYISRLEGGSRPAGPMLRHFLAFYFGITPDVVATWFPAREKKAA